MKKKYYYIEIKKMAKHIKKSKYTFTLYNVDIISINLKYNIKHKDNSSIDTTEVKLLNNKGNKQTISFLDESKRLHNCSLSMIDYNNNYYNCFWCKNKFSTIPIGCPINYVSNKATKKYYSNISKEQYTIKENITNNRTKQIENNEKITVKEEDYYQTDGIFCSFNCCKAFINDNKHKRLYDYSNNLLTKMYNDLMKTKSVIISPAPHWRTLKEYGGNLDINSFRNTFNKMDYEYHGISTKNSIKYLPIKMFFEEKIKF